MSLADEIRKLQELREAGALTEEEFSQAKSELESAPSKSKFPGGGSFSTLDHELAQGGRRRKYFLLWLVILSIFLILGFLEGMLQK